MFGDRVLLGGIGSIAVRPLDADGRPIWGVAEHAVEAAPAGHAAGPCRITLSVDEHRHRLECQVRPWK